MTISTLFEIVKILVIPASIVIVGIIITSKIDSRKTWDTKWSESFYKLFQEFNNAFEDLIYCIWQLSERSQKGSLTLEEEKQFMSQISKISAEIERKEFGMRTQLCFAPKTKDDIISLSEKLRSQINDLLKTKKGHIDAIHNTLFELNRKAKVAHGEILGVENK
jgi:uncharacterized coiled-coil DUF342 family protein